jgi:hypothetical protein
VSFAEKTDSSNHRACVIYLLAFRLILSCFLLGSERELIFLANLVCSSLSAVQESNKRHVPQLFLLFTQIIHIFSQSATRTLFTMLCHYAYTPVICQRSDSAPNVLVSINHKSLHAQGATTSYSYSTVPICKQH